MSFAQFELTLAASQQEDPGLPIAAARGVFQRANKYTQIKMPDCSFRVYFCSSISFRSLRSAAQAVGLDVATNKEERLMLLEAWQEFESEHGDEASRRAVANLLPKRVKKRRRIQTQDGVWIWDKFALKQLSSNSL